MKYSLAILSALFCVLLLSGCSQKTSYDYYLQSQLEAQHGNLNAALAALSVAIEKNPKLGLAYVSRGEIYKQQGDYQQAASDFEKAAKIEPYNFDAHYQLGVVYQYLKRFADAIVAYQKAVEIRPLDPAANMNLALSYSQNNEPAKGLPYAQQAVSSDPNSATAHANLGTLYAIVGDEALAIDEFKKSIELNSRQPEVYVNLAEEFIKQSKWEQAREVLEDGKQFGPSPAVSERLGLCYYKIGDLEKASASYEDALHQNPSYYLAMNGLGVVHMTHSLRSAPPDVQQAREAIEFWKKSLMVDPNQPVIQELVERYSGQAADKNSNPS